MTLEIEYSGSRTKLAIALVSVALISFLGACSGPGPDGDGTVILTVAVEANPGAPDNYGAEPGGPIAGAEVRIRDLAKPDTAWITSTADDSGRVTFTVTSGTYDIWVERGTKDPYCTWVGSESVEVGNRDQKVTLNRLGVVCQ
jgi:hypothetical protein